MWDVRAAEFGSRAATEYMIDGWQPFAVAVVAGVTTLYLRRLNPEPDDEG